MIDYAIDLASAGFVYFIMFIVGGSAFSLCLLLMTKFFRRLAYGKNDTDK